MRHRVNDGVTELALDTAGGRVRFKTDSKRLAFHVKLRKNVLLSHMPLSGTSGVDLYSGTGTDSKFLGSVRPENESRSEYEGVLALPGRLSDYTVNLPLYNGAEELFIGVDPDAALEAPSPYRFQVPFVTYGSSITQGGCASRPGNAYQAFLSRWLNADFINLGFSGSARGEESIAEYIAGLKMSVFVLDYDHNAPNPEHLEKTHERFFKIIREKNPTLPVVLITKPDFGNSPEDSARRREIVFRTYRNAFATGDRNVFFINGEELFGDTEREACTVDRTHPNDIGFYRMARRIYTTLMSIYDKM